MGTGETKAESRKNPITIPNSEQGYILLFALFLCALLVIALGIAVPQVAKSIQRDKELEAYHCGLQYRRAIQLYYRKFNAYPPNVDALVQTNNIRFLRKKYLDPMTRKDDWQPILFGQNKVPTAIGFFGQPLANGATSIVPTGPGGNNGAYGSGSGSGGGILGVMGGLFTGTPDTSSNTSTGDTSSTNPGSTDSSGSSGTAVNGGTVSTGGSGQTGQTGQTGLTGQTFGGAGIIGFKPPLQKKSILVYKKKNHYNEWEFTYDPISDQQVMTGGASTNPAGTNPQNPSTTPGTTPTTPTTTPTQTTPTY